MVNSERDRRPEEGGVEPKHQDELTVDAEALSGAPGERLEKMPLAREIPGRYRFVREHASGGMGRILLVHDSDTGREVVLKELASKVVADAATASNDEAQNLGGRAVRFLREARVTGQLEHPAIVPIYELGRRTDGTLYYTMRFIRGRTLEQALGEARTLSERLSLLPHFMDMCQAIAYAHSRGFIHRDLKPSNVLVGEFGETVVIDWGLATRIGQKDETEASEPDIVKPAGTDVRLTRDGQSLGTPRYMSPEQIRGDLAAIAAPTDVYALGVILYEILTGQHPFENAEATALFNEILTRDPVPPRLLEPKAPAELCAICLRAISRHTTSRYATAGELVKELKRFQSGALVEAYQYSAMDRARRFARRHVAVLSAIAVGVVAALTTGAFAIRGIVREQARTERALYHSLIGMAHNAVDNGRLEEAQDALARAPVSYRGLEWGIVDGLCHPERLILPHDEVVSFGMYSPDGARIVTCSMDERAFIWDATTGQKLHELRSPPKEAFVRAVWSADGSRLILTSWQEYAYIYDTRDYTELRHLRGYAPALSPDGKVLALATEDGQVVTLYDASSGNILLKFPPLPVHVIQLAISDDGRRLAAGINNGSVWVWSLDGHAAWNSGPVHAPSTRHVVFSPDSTQLLSSGADGRSILWDAGSGVEVRRLEGHESSVNWACFLMGGRQIITASSDRTARLWDAKTGASVAKHKGFSGPLGFVSVRPDGSEFVTHLDSNSGRMSAIVCPVIPLMESHTLAAHNAMVNCAAFSPDGRTLASGGGSSRNRDDDRVIFWNTRDHSIWREIKTGHGPVLGLAYFPDGTRVATGNEDGTASIFDAGTGQCLHTMSGHGKSCGSVAVSPDGSVLATASWDNNAILWDTATGQRRALLLGDPNRLDAVVFDPEGRLVATGGMDGHVRLYRVSDGRVEGELLPRAVQLEGRLEENRRIGALAFSPDGARLVAAGDTGRVTMWDMANRREIRTFKGHKSYVKAAVFSHDGRRLVTAGKDAAIWFWDVETGEPVTFLERHKNDVNALALRGDGGLMASASNDTTVVLWPIRPWREGQQTGRGQANE